MDSGGISQAFIEEHMGEYQAAYDLLEDSFSKDCFAAYLNCRNNEDYRFLLPCSRERVSYFHNPFYDVTDHEAYLDVGAYDGDTIREFVEAAGGNYQKIIAIEPEPDSYQKLERYVVSSQLSNVDLYKNGCWDRTGTLYFVRDQESSRIGDEGDALPVQRLDEQFWDEAVTLVKINFLSGVVETLKGATEILQNRRPKLAITVGFDEWGIIRIPQTIQEINPDYRFGLRYASPMPARLILFCY